MGICVEKLPHSCGTKKGLQVYFDEDTGTYNGHCFKCGAHVDDPYGDNPPPVIDAEAKVDIFTKTLKEVGSLKAVDLPTRRLRASTLNLYNVKVGLSETDGKSPFEVYFPYFAKNHKPPVRIKTRILDPKKMWSASDPRHKEIELFGWRKAREAGSKNLYITEGEFDAMALYEIMLRHTKEGYSVPIPVSLPNGAAAAKRDLTKVKKDVLSFYKEDDIVLVFDQDEAGQAAILEALKVFPRAKVANLPRKDANECLKECPKAAFAACQFNSAKAKNSRLINAEDLHDEAKEVAAFGVDWPWQGITDLTRGIRKGETIYIGAGAKVGKSEVVNALAAHLIKNIGWTVMLAKPEEANKKTYKMIAGKLTGKVFHDPKVEFDEAAYDKAGSIIKGKLKLLNLFQHVGWETLAQDIRDAANNGVDAVFIDPITNLTNGMDPSAANTKLQEIAQELSAMALDLNIVIFIFCHLRNPDNGPDHTHGGKVLTSQFAGSRAMERSCNYMFGIECDKSLDRTPDERNLRTVVLLADREFGEVGETVLYWDRNTQLFNEIKK